VSGLIDEDDMEELAKKTSAHTGKAWQLAAAEAAGLSGDGARRAAALIDAAVKAVRAERRLSGGPVEGQGGGLASDGPALPMTLAEAERAAIIEAFRFHGGNKTKTASFLGLTTSTLRRKLNQHGIE
jgi:DNA-binding NtrC family response regulator